MHDFVNELNQLNIGIPSDQLQSALITNPQENYDTFINNYSAVSKTNTCQIELCDSIKRSIRRQSD